jgi:hypothetical protein
VNKSPSLSGFGEPWYLQCFNFYYPHCRQWKVVPAKYVLLQATNNRVRGERNIKILLVFLKSPRFSLTSPSSQLNEKSCRPVFIKCGDRYFFNWFIIQTEYQPWLYLWILCLILFPHGRIFPDLSQNKCAALKKDAINEFEIKYWISKPVWVNFKQLLMLISLIKAVVSGL